MPRLPGTGVGHLLIQLQRADRLEQIDGLRRRLRGAQAQAADGGEGVVQEVGLDLGHHDLDALLRRQRVFVRPDKLEVQPDMVEHAADHDGYGQEADGCGVSATEPSSTSASRSMNTENMGIQLSLRLEGW